MPALATSLVIQLRAFLGRADVIEHVPVMMLADLDQIVTEYEMASQRSGQEALRVADAALAELAAAIGPPTSAPMERAAMHLRSQIGAEVDTLCPRCLSAPKGECGCYSDEAHLGLPYPSSPEKIIAAFREHDRDLHRQEVHRRGDE